MVRFSGVIRIELSAAINALHHSPSLRDASWTAVAVYQKKLYTGARTFSWTK